MALGIDWTPVGAACSCPQAERGAQPSEGLFSPVSTPGIGRLHNPGLLSLFSVSMWSLQLDHTFSRVYTLDKDQIIQFQPWLVVSLGWSTVLYTKMLPV